MVCGRHVVPQACDLVWRLDFASLKEEAEPANNGAYTKLQRIIDEAFGLKVFTPHPEASGNFAESTAILGVL
jgi:hypothetical protein